MNGADGKRLPALGPCLALVCMVGCAGGPSLEMARLNPLRRGEWAEEAQFGSTPADRISELRSLASRAVNAGPEQYQLMAQQAQQLTERLQSEPDPLIRIEIVRALGVHRVPATASALKMALSDSDTEVRIAACKAWQRHGGSDAVAALSEVLASDTDVDIRLAAARALGVFRDPEAIRGLAIALDDPDPALQHRAIQSLKLVSDRDYGGDLKAWRQFAQGSAPPLPSRPSLVNRLRRLF